MIKIDALVEGGKASAGPPLGPALGPAGVNINQVIGTINEKTKVFDGMKVPVKVIVDPATKSFEIEVGTPPASALIIKELGIEKGSGEAGANFVGNLALEQIIKIAKMKKDSLLATDTKAGVMEIAGTCVSMGITIEGKSTKDFQKEVSNGNYDDFLAGEEW
ncbi:MAG: 50S ribosomal protein L11 [Candidatus Hydrothermarchaeales archaeon]